MSGHIVDLAEVSEAITTFLIGIVNFILYGIADAVPPLGFLAGLANFIGGEPVLRLLSWVVAITIMIIWATVLHLLTMIWLERKVVARMQDRRGPMLSQPLKKNWYKGTGYFQQIADALKLLQKENITPAAADKVMFHVAPALLISSTVFVLVALPFSEGFVVADVPAGILLIIAAFSLTPLAILLAAWAQNNKYALLGGMRAAAMMMSYEIPMILVTIGVIILAGTLNPIEIVAAQSQASILGPLAALGIRNWFIIPQILGFFIFILAMLAETERMPFDLPEAEEELVTGWLVEYGGMRYGMVFGFKWLRTLVGAALVALLFLGGWDGPILPQEIWFIIKVYFVFFIFVWISWSVPRIRIDQMMNLGWRKLIPLSLLNILIAILVILVTSQGWV
ncbi:MAG: NADH-quinone oxidoreductase subunit NuoH [Thermoplasmata archaeon]